MWSAANTCWKLMFLGIDVCGHRYRQLWHPHSGSGWLEFNVLEFLWCRRCNENESHARYYAFRTGVGARPSVKFFSKLNYLFLDTLTQQIIFLIIKINIFWGDLSGISAKTATLKTMCCRILIIESHHCTCVLPDCHTLHEQRVRISALRTQAEFDECFCVWPIYQSHSFIRCKYMLLFCLLLACVDPWTGVVWCCQLPSGAFVVASVWVTSRRKPHFIII